MKIFLLPLFFLTLSFSVKAQVSRWIDIEWEPVPEARDYEVELYQEEESGSRLPRGKYKTESPAWSHAVVPGRYSLRIRSLDRRGVPGEWSDFIPVKVRMENPRPLRPVANDKIDDPQVQFEWSEVSGAANYQLVVLGDTGEVLHNAVTSEQKMTFFLEGLGTYKWGTFALEKDEGAKPQQEWTQSSFRNFTRVGGELEAPTVAITVGEKVNLKWNGVRPAKFYEVDYLPPANSGEKNRRFKLQRTMLTFDSRRLKEGTTTLTVQAEAPGYQDSPKSLVKIAKSGNKVEIEDIIQGKKEEVIKLAPNRAYYRDQIFLSVALARYSYESEDIETDTRLEQEKLTGLGINFEWVRQPKLNSLVQKLDLSILNLSSGLESGLSTHLSYTFHWWKNWEGKKFLYGAGLSYLGLPAFMGDRIEDDINVENNSSIGPELALSYLHPLGTLWGLHSHLNFAYHPVYLSSKRDDGDAYYWIRGQVRGVRYMTDTQAVYLGVDYQMWDQKWGEDYSALSGLAINFGFKAGFN